MEELHALADDKHHEDRSEEPGGLIGTARKVGLTARSHLAMHNKLLVSVPPPTPQSLPCATAAAPAVKHLLRDSYELVIFHRPIAEWVLSWSEFET